MQSRAISQAVPGFSINSPQNFLHRIIISSTIITNAIRISGSSSIVSSHPKPSPSAQRHRCAAAPWKVPLLFLTLALSSSALSTLPPQSPCQSAYGTEFSFVLSHSSAQPWQVICCPRDSRLLVSAGRLRGAAAAAAAVAAAENEQAAGQTRCEQSRACHKGCCKHVQCGN